MQDKQGISKIVKIPMHIEIQKPSLRTVLESVQSPKQ